MLTNYLKMAVKVLNRRWFYTFISMFGITFTLAILVVVFSFWDHLVGQHAPEVHMNNSLVVASIKTEGVGGWTNTGPNSTYFLERYVRPLKTPEKMTFYSLPTAVTTFIDSKKVSIDRKYTDADFWDVFQFKFLEGRPFQAQEVENQEPVCVISQALKQEIFGDASALGRQIKLDQTLLTVVGVINTTPITRIHTYGQLYMPYSLHNGFNKDTGFQGMFIATLVASNKSELPAIQAEYAAMMQSVENPNPDDIKNIYSYADPYLAGFTRIMGLGSGDDSGVSMLYITLTILGMLFVLLPTVNLMNINISRIMERSSEIGVRKAFGASSGMLIFQFVIENLVLTLLCGILAFGVAYLAIYLINSAHLIEAMELHINVSVFFSGLALTVLFGLISGVYPAWRMSRMQISDALKLK